MSIELHQPAEPVNDLDTIIRTAERIANTGIIPKQYRGKPDDIIAAGIMGAEAGLALMASLRAIHVVDGRPEFSAEGYLMLIRHAGHSVVGTVTSTEATVTGTRRDTGDTMTVTFDVGDAEAAGLLGRGSWKKHVKDMLWARAVSQLRRRLFPDVALGSYTHGEISGADTWEPVDPVIVDGDTGEQVAITEAATVYADPAVLDLVRDLITEELTDGDRTTLAGWMKQSRLPSLKHDTIPAAAVEAVHNKVLDLLEDHDEPVTPADYTIEDSVPAGEPF